MQHQMLDYQKCHSRMEEDDVMIVEKRRYKITGFREHSEDKIRVILDPADPVKPVNKIGMTDMMRNPMGTAQQMMGQQMDKMIHDTFSISREEYQNQKYAVGEFVIVSITRA